MLNVTDIILASQSPRRFELLTAMGVRFRVVVSHYAEQLDDARSPAAVAVELASGKAATVAEQYPDAVVIGADTIVTVGGQQLEKPRDLANARRMLQKLSGTYNDVTTGVAVIRVCDGLRLEASVTTRVFFKPYDAAAVETYVMTGDPLDKAGAYGIQSGAAALISHIEGNYDTVVGLPTQLLSDLLKTLGLESRPVVLPSPF